MNAITTRPPSGGGLIPANVAEAMDLARMMADCGMLPEQFRGKPGNALMVVEQAMRWGLSPFSVAQEVSFIQGKPFYSGKIMAGALNAAPGVLQGRLRYEYTGSGDERTVRVLGTLRGEAEPREATVRLRDAKTQNKVWSTQPDQQLAYHGARVWGRRHVPEVMLGAWAPEEFDGAADERAEPRQVQSTVIRPDSKPEAVTHHTPSRPKPALDPVAAMERATQQPTMDETLGGDGIPDWDAPAPPKPDRLRKVADRIKERLSAMQTDADYRAIMEHDGIAVEWAKIVADRPELAEELEQHRAAELDRIASAEASAP